MSLASSSAPQTTELWNSIEQQNSPEQQNILEMFWNNRMFWNVRPMPSFVIVCGGRSPISSPSNEMWPVCRGSTTRMLRLNYESMGLMVDADLTEQNKTE